MNPYSLLSFTSFIVYLYLGIYTLLKDKKSRLNRTFFFVCLSFAVWAFSYTFLYPAKDKETAWFWLRAGSIGWCSFAAFMLHFSLLLTRNPLLKKWWICPLIYIPAIISLARSLTGALLIYDFIQMPFGWVFVIPVSSGWVWFFYFYYSIYVVLSIWLYKMWGDKSSLPREKKQAKAIIAGTMLSLIFGSLVDVILPALKLYILPPITIVFVLMWASGMCCAIVKYKMMVLNPEVSVDEIATMMRELLILINLDGNIIKVNPKARELLGYSENELKGKSIEVVIVEKEKIRDYLAKIKGNLSFDLGDELKFETKEGEIIPVQAGGILIKSKDEDTLGIIIIGEDLRKVRELEKIQKKLELFTNFLSGNLMVPVKHIEGFCDALLKYHTESLDPQTKESLESIFQRCKEVNLLVEDFIKSEGL